MLAALRINHFAIIDSLTVELDEGLTVLTGETGAGKSILVDALHLALGGRAQAEVIRTGCEEASVEAVFRIDAPAREKLVSLGLPDSADGELLIRRLIYRTNRSKVWVNGALCTVSVLEQLARRLCDISSQHEHMSLLDPSVHLDLVDAQAGLADQRLRYRAAYDAWQTAFQARRALLTDESERAQRADYLAFQLKEIDELDPQSGEEAQLATERALLASAAKLQGAAQAAEERLYSGEGSALEGIASALENVGQIVAIDGRWEPLRQTLARVRTEVEEAARELTQLSRDSREDPVRLEAVDDRLTALRRLARKHGVDLEALLQKRQAMREELSGLDRHGERLEELEAAEAKSRSHAEKEGASLSAARREAGERLVRALGGELSKLGLQKSRFEVRFEPGPLGPLGAESAEFFFSANPGEALKPLAKSASGGELSRIMLAFKRAGAGADPVDVYVFDEVDSGIGGPTAQVVGRMLKEVAAHRQVLCITHLPQIAAFADQHLVVRKLLREGRTSSEVELLQHGDARTREVARMLSGEELTPVALKHARELIKRSAATEVHPA